MFAVEIGGSILASSSALQADALDFLADAANYAISLSVAGLALAWRARASTGGCREAREGRTHPAACQAEAGRAGAEC